MATRMTEDDNRNEKSDTRSNMGTATKRTTYGRTENISMYDYIGQLRE